MCGSMIYGHLWSALAPATLPACCISGQHILVTAWRQGINDPRVASLPQVHPSHMHFLIMWQFISGCLVLNLSLKKKKKKTKTSCQCSRVHVTHSLVTILEVIANREWEKGKVGGPAFSCIKKWVKRDSYWHQDQIVPYFCCSLQNCVGEPSTVLLRWKNHFFNRSLFLTLSMFLSSGLTDSDTIVWVKSSSFVLLTRRLFGWVEDREVRSSSQFHHATPVCIHLLLHTSGWLEPTSLCVSEIHGIVWSAEERGNKNSGLWIWQLTKPKGKNSANGVKQTKHAACASCLNGHICTPHPTTTFVILSMLPWAPCPPALPEVRHVPGLILFFFFWFLQLGLFAGVWRFFDIKNSPHLSLWLAGCKCVRPAVRTPRDISLWCNRKKQCTCVCAHVFKLT